MSDYFSDLQESVLWFLISNLQLLVSSLFHSGIGNHVYIVAFGNHDPAYVVPPIRLLAVSNFPSASACSVRPVGAEFKFPCWTRTERGYVLSAEHVCFNTSFDTPC